MVKALHKKEVRRDRKRSSMLILVEEIQGERWEGSAVGTANEKVPLKDVQDHFYEIHATFQEQGAEDLLKGGRRKYAGRGKRENWEKL